MFEKMKVKDVMPGDVNLFQGKHYLIVSVIPPHKLMSRFWNITFMPAFHGESCYPLSGEEEIDIYRPRDNE
jgi:hypothetical protein